MCLCTRIPVGVVLLHGLCFLLLIIVLAPTPHCPVDVEGKSDRQHHGACCDERVAQPDEEGVRANVVRHAGRILQERTRGGREKEKGKRKSSRGKERVRWGPKDAGPQTDASSL